MEMSDEVWVASTGDTFDIIALNVYGRESYASDIMCANPTLCGKMIFDGGEMVQLPVIYIPDDEGEEQFGAANAPWKG